MEPALDGGSDGSSAWLAILSVVLGGLIVLVGQFFALLAQRRSERHSARRGFRLDATSRCADAARELRAALAATATSPRVPNREQASRILQAKSAFDVALPRVHDDETRRRIREWSDQALVWANGELGNETEDTAWRLAMARLGEVERELA